MISPETIPGLAPNVCFENKAGQTYLYNPEVQKYVLLDNQVSIDVVAMCDGQRTTRSIANALASRYDGAEPAIVLDDVRKMLSDLGVEEFILFRAASE